MKSFFSKILLAQVIAVVLALAVVTIITRVSLDRGFRNFLQTQETTVLETVAPMLGEYYSGEGSWQRLANNPQSWQRIWRATRLQEPGQRRPARPRPGGPPRNRPPPPPPEDIAVMRWMRPADRGLLRERLFLLDRDQQRVAGARVESTADLDLQAIEVDGEVVGWIGFTPIGEALPPEAERFFRGQFRISMLALIIALTVAAALSFLLARHLSRPVRQLNETVRGLSRGEYGKRAAITTLDETGRLAEHVNQLAASLEKNRTARRRWMADIAHELRTPVAVLKGEIEALSDGIRPANERMNRSLQEEIGQLSSLIDDLQTLALSDAGALDVRKEPARLDSLIEQCADGYRDRLAERGIGLNVSVKPYEMDADPQRLRQLLQNLLENASRYVEQNGVVNIRLDNKRGGAEISIADSGPGLADVQLERLFERFYRVEESRTRSRGGTGLGLSICRNIVEAHGGRIEAGHSDLGGLVIRIFLPDGS